MARKLRVDNPYLSIGSKKIAFWNKQAFVFLKARYLTIDMYVLSHNSGESLCSLLEEGFSDKIFISFLSLGNLPQYYTILIMSMYRSILLLCVLHCAVLISAQLYPSWFMWGTATASYQVINTTNIINSMN